MVTDTNKYSAIFEYLSAPDRPTRAEAAVVFGRKDSLLATTLGDLIGLKLVTLAVITGGKGKDSGDIEELGFGSEAAYLMNELVEDRISRGYTLPVLELESAAKNGAENAKNSLAILKAKGIGTSSVTAVAHATSSRRLAEALRHAARQEYEEDITVHRVPTAYPFDPTNPHDQAEAAAELLRLADWPAQGWLESQVDLPEDLVQFAREHQPMSS